MGAVSIFDTASTEASDVFVSTTRSADGPSTVPPFPGPSRVSSGNDVPSHREFILLDSSSPSRGRFAEAMAAPATGDSPCGLGHVAASFDRLGAQLALGQLPWYLAWYWPSKAVRAGHWGDSDGPIAYCVS